MGKVTQVDMLRSWEDAVKALGLSVPGTWTKLGNICRILNALHPGYVNLLLPTGGHTEFTGAALSRVPGSIDLEVGGAYITVRPIRMIYDSVNVDPRWSYMRLECAPPSPDSATASGPTPKSLLPSTGPELEPALPKVVPERTDEAIRAQIDELTYSWCVDGPIMFLPKGSQALYEVLSLEDGRMRISSAEDLKSIIEYLAGRSMLAKWPPRSDQN